MKEGLGINEWLELIKEDKNLNGAYISISQYIYLIEKETQELKLELSGYRHAILNNKEMLGLKEQNDKLKKQIEEINKMIEKCGFVNIEQVILNYCGLLSQQKEFISYLENEIKSINPEHDIEEVYRVHGYEVMLNYTLLIKVLQKCRSIMGVSDENKANI